jgi:hypothetical protein
MTDQFISGGDELPSGHVLALTAAYAKVLDALGYSPAPYPDTSERCGGSHHAGARYDCLNHAYWMCERIESFVATNRLPKALRWLGTVQGMLIMGGVFSINEIMSHDRTPPDAKTIAQYMHRGA